MFSTDFTVRTQAPTEPILITPNISQTLSIKRKINNTQFELPTSFIFSIFSYLDHNSAFRSLLTCRYFIQLSWKERIHGASNFHEYLMKRDFKDRHLELHTKIDRFFQRIKNLEARQLIWYRLNSLYGFPNVTSVPASCLTQLSDGRLAMSRRNDNRSVVSWRPLNERTPLKHLFHHKQPVKCIAQLADRVSFMGIFPRGRLVSSAAKQLYISEFAEDVSSPRTTADSMPVTDSYIETRSFDEEITSIMCLNHPHNNIALGFTTGSVRVRESMIPGSRELWVYPTLPEHHKEAVQGIAQIAHDRILSWSEKSIIVHPLDRSASNTISYPKQQITCVQLLRDGRIAVGIGGFFPPHLIEIRSLDGSSIIQLQGHKTKITSIIQLDDGCIASLSLDRVLKIWNTSNEAETCTKLPAGNCLIQLKDGRIAIGGGTSPVTVTKIDELLFRRALHGNRLLDTPPYAQNDITKKRKKS